MIEKVDPKTNAKVKVSNFTPADYEREIVYRTGDELRKWSKGRVVSLPPVDRWLELRLIIARICENAGEGVLGHEFT